MRMQLDNQTFFLRTTSTQPTHQGCVSPSMPYKAMWKTRQTAETGWCRVSVYAVSIRPKPNNVKLLCEHPKMSLYIYSLMWLFRVPCYNFMHQTWEVRPDFLSFIFSCGFPMFACSYFMQAELTPLSSTIGFLWNRCIIGCMVDAWEREFMAQG
jgi:hypothetical protein